MILALSPSAPVFAGQQTGKTAPEAAAAEPKPEDRGWPRTYPVPSGGKLTLYQPQISAWENQKHMVAYGAVAYLPTDASKPELGTVKVEADTKVSVEERLVNFAPLKITEANFPTVSKEKTAEIVKIINDTIPEYDRVISLDRVM
ncbi:MAG: hypothetical protein ACYC8T_27590, partial [Myxococcaceae bacterium]